jgi:Tol biopolymer transport system component
VLAVLAASGCTRGGFAPLGDVAGRDVAGRDVTGRDGRPLEARPGDRAPDHPLADRSPADRGRTCSWTGNFTFTAPAPLTVLNSTVEDANPFVTPDGLTLFLESKRAGGVGKEDIWVSTRPSAAAAWAAPTLLPGLNTSGSESAYSQTADGLTAFLSTSWAGGAGGWDIWMLTRSSVTVAFDPSSAVPVAAVNDGELQWDPMPSADGLRLYLSTQSYPVQLGGLGGAEVVVATRASATAPFGNLAPVASVNSSASEANPTLTADLHVILLASNRPGGLGGYDLWYAVSLDGAYSTPKPVPTLNSASNDLEPFVTADGCEVYFASDRPGGLGGWDLYHASYLALP